MCRQSLKDSLIQVKEDNQELKEKLSATTNKLDSANKEQEQRGTCTYMLKLHPIMCDYSI